MRIRIDSAARSPIRWSRLPGSFAAIAAIPTIATIPALAAIPAIAIAQTDTIQTVDTLAVTVTRGTALQRVPAAVSVVSRERIQAGRMGVSLDEALSDVPGVQVSNRYNFALGPRISLRGFGARAAFGVRGIRLVADGIPLTMPDGQSTLNNIDLTSAGRIEVLRGAASMLHGNAAGGVIEIISERPPDGFMFEARAAGAGLGRNGIGDVRRFNTKLGGGNRQTRYLLSAAHASGRGFREHSRFEQNNLSFRAEHARPRAVTSFTLSLADAPDAENPGSLPRDSARLKPRMAWPRNVAMRAGESSRHLQLGVGHQQGIGAVRLAATAYGVIRKLDNPLPFAYITLDRRAGGVRSTLGTRTLTFGVDVEAQEDERAEYDNVAGARGAARRSQIDRSSSLGPFARWELALSPATTVSAGIRYDRVHFEVTDHYLADGRDDSGERTMSALSPSAGMTFSLRNETTLFAAVSTSFQTPTTTELINAPPPAGGVCCAAGFNPLEPQRAIAFEIGARTPPHGAVVFDAALFHMRVRDALVPYQIPEVPGRDFYRNAGRTKHWGAELSANVRLTREVRLAASYTYSDFTFVDDGIDTVRFEGKRLPGVAPHHAVIRTTFSAAGIVIEPEAELTSAYFADDANSVAARNEAATVFNVLARAPVARGRTRAVPFAAVNNVTNSRYSSSVVINAAGGRFFEPAPGRNFFIGLSLGVGNGASDR